MNIDRRFQLTARGTNLRTEALAGLTTFVAMLYIIVVNPTMLSQAGIDFGGAYQATILASVTGMLIMGLAANYPVAVAPGIGINAFFVFQVIIAQGVPWQEALGAACLASGIFLLVSVTSIRRLLIEAIPESLKLAITAGIGLFIAMIGLINGKLVVGSPTTVVMLGDLSEPTAYLTLIGLLVTMVLMVNRIQGAVFLGMLVTTGIALLQGFLVLPEAPFMLPEGLDRTFGQMSFAHIDQMGMVIFVLLMVILFDTTGTLIGIGRQAGIIRKGHFPHLQNALLADAVASFFGALCGTGPTSSFAESGAGVAVGGRTGLANVVTAGLFLLMLFCEPSVKALSAMPSITAPALILVGCLLMEGVRDIDWSDKLEALPAFLTILLMPLSYSITTGVGAGIIVYTLLQLFSGHGHSVHPILYVFFVLFIVQFVFLE